MVYGRRLIMKNFQITDKETDKKYWISRSICTCIIPVVIYHGNIIGVLASKRGDKTPNEQGKWNLTCGYLDYDETTMECAQRELWEELGLKIPLEKFQLYKIIDDPKKDWAQNVSFRYIVKLPLYEVLDYLHDSADLDSESRGGENSEVSDIRLILKEDLSKYNWAFNHLDLIHEVFNYLES